MGMVATNRKKSTKNSTDTGLHNVARQIVGGEVLVMTTTIDDDALVGGMWWKRDMYTRRAMDVQDPPEGAVVTAGKVCSSSVLSKTPF